MARSTLAALVAAFLLIGCGDRSRHYHAHGVVRDVDVGLRQVVIEHEDVPGLMPAMTMSFAVDDPAIIEHVRPGEEVAFEIAFDGSSYRVTAIEGHGGTNPGAERAPAPRLGDVADEGQLAPDFRLVDQDGRPVALSDLRGRAVVLDFIYASCPGPCPIQTSKGVTLQRSLAPELRARTHFVSISLDPDVDTPERLRAYATARGVDLADWSFLTGPRAEVEPIVRRWGVGTTRNPDGTIGHVIVTFLIDPDGRITKRWLGGVETPEDIASALARVLEPGAPVAAR